MSRVNASIPVAEFVARSKPGWEGGTRFQAAAISEHPSSTVCRDRVSNGEFGFPSQNTSFAQIFEKSYVSSSSPLARFAEEGIPLVASVSCKQAKTTKVIEMEFYSTLQLFIALQSHPSENKVFLFRSPEDRDRYREKVAEGELSLLFSCGPQSLSFLILCVQCILHEVFVFPPSSLAA